MLQASTGAHTRTHTQLLTNCTLEHNAMLTIADTVIVPTTPSLKCVLKCGTFTEPFLKHLPLDIQALQNLHKGKPPSSCWIEKSRKCIRSFRLVPWCMCHRARGIKASFAALRSQHYVHAADQYWCLASHQHTNINTPIKQALKKEN